VKYVNKRTIVKIVAKKTKIDLIITTSVVYASIGVIMTNAVAYTGRIKKRKKTGVRKQIQRAQMMMICIWTKKIRMLHSKDKRWNNMLSCKDFQ